MAKIQSGATADELTIDPTSKAARATLYDAAGNPVSFSSHEQSDTPAGLLIMGKNDERMLPFRVDRRGSIATAAHTPLLNETFEGGTLNTQRFLVTATTMAAVQTSVAGLTINSGNITTINTGYLLQSAKRFTKMQRVPLHLKARARLNFVNNSVMELGFGDAATFNGANSNGAYWQVTSSGVVQPVLTFNGVDITGADIRVLLDETKYYVWDVYLDDDEAVFFVQDSTTGLILSRQSIAVPLSAARMFATSALPSQVRLYNTAVAPATAPTLILTDLYVLDLDAQKNKAWPDVLASMERGHSANPLTAAQLAQWANSAEPANATLSNTAAGYTTLGGRFQFAAPAGAVTDFALFGFQVPAPTNFHVTGVDIDVWNLGAAVATTPHLLTWAIAVGSTAVSLATASVMRTPLGAMSLPVATPIGGLASPRISKPFDTPLFCPSGRFVHLILRIPVGTATASQVIAGMASIQGYFE